MSDHGTTSPQSSCRLTSALFGFDVEIWRTFSAVLRPPPDETPAQFAEHHRVLHAIYCSENPGPWSNAHFPYQPDVMDVAQEAIETGKRGVVFMKAGQIGGTDCMINAQCWLKLHYPGPQLFMTSTDKVAIEFGRERFELILADMPPLAAKRITSVRGEILVKRFTDGKINLCGGQSVFNLQSSPYRIVVIDELDSLVADLGGTGDPLKLAEVRTDSFGGPTLILAYAHPTSKAQGAGKLYYTESDQRRGHIKHSCGGEFWIDWFSPVVVQCKPRLEGQTQQQAERDPDCYQFLCPHCGKPIGEEERVSMLRAGVRQKSVLPPEEAAKKRWIGVHASQLYTPAKPFRSFVERYIAAIGDDNAMRVFVNKVLGDVYEPKTKEIDESALRALMCVRRRERDPEFYSRKQVPPHVLFLTAGQDSRSTQFHFAIWGWGVREDLNQARHLCGWLIDWGEIAREYALTFTDAEYHVFDDLIYHRRLRSSLGRRTYQVRACGHDIGYQPTQIPIVRYCRTFPGRAMPVRGAAETPTSASHADYVRLSHARKFKVGDTEAVDDPALLLNTYLLKTDFYGMIDQRIEVPDMRLGPAGPERIGTRLVPRLNLPEDCGDLWFTHARNEYLGDGEKKGEKIWLHRGPNHLADCNTYAYALCLFFDPFAGNLTAAEHEQRENESGEAEDADDGPGRGGGGFDPAMG